MTDKAFTQLMAKTYDEHTLFTRRLRKMLSSLSRDEFEAVVKRCIKAIDKDKVFETSLYFDLYRECVSIKFIRDSQLNWFERLLNYVRGK